MLTIMSNELKDGIWIRPDGTDAGACGKLEAALFRLEIKAEQPVKTAELHITAADRYRLYVNGKSVICGPRKGDQWNRYYETVDIAPYLVVGKNYITVRVISYAHVHSQSTQVAPFSVYVAQVGAVLMTKCVLELENGEAVELSTGKADWTAAKDESFLIDNSLVPYVGATEMFFAEKCLPWRENREMGWEKAVKAFGSGINEYGEFSPLQMKKRHIPNMEEVELKFTAQLENLEGENGFAFDENGVAVIPAGATRVAELDAGVLRTAYLRLKAQGAGGCVKVIYAERYFPKDPDAPTGPMPRDDRENGRIVGSNETAATWQAHHDYFYTAEKEMLFENFWFRTFRYVRIEVTAGDVPVTLHMPDFADTKYPLDVKAQLDFADERMAKLWDISVRTLRSCMHETHEDCPYYEQLQYILDTRLQMQFTYAISGDTRMAENVLWDYHCSQLPDGILQSRYPCTHTQVIPDFSIYWIYMLEEHYIQTGDDSLIRFYRPTMDKVLNYFDNHMGDKGLVEKLGYWEFGDWLDAWNKNQGTPTATYHGPSALHNLTYALGLRTAARMMRVIGKDAIAADYDDRADAIGKNVVELCYDAQRGVLREGPAFEQYTQHVQALAVLCDALTGVEAKVALRHAMEDADMLPCTFPWQYTLFRALEKLGMYELTEPVWEQYFSMLDRHLTTVPEKPGDTRSDCHAWSALPLYEYPRMLLGVQPGKPGWEEVIVRPRAIGIDRFGGTVPTPKGDVTVSWRMENNRMRVVVTAPVPVKVVVGDRVYESKSGKLSV